LAEEEIIVAAAHDEYDKRVSMVEKLVSNYEADATKHDLLGSAGKFKKFYLTSL